VGGVGVCSQGVSISYRAKGVSKAWTRLIYRAPMAQRAIGQLNGLFASISDANPGASDATSQRPMPLAFATCPDHLKRAVGVQWLTLRADDHSVRSHIGHNARQHPIRHRGSRAAYDAPDASDAFHRTLTNVQRIIFQDK
jgi:hypothetical protein